MDKKDNTKENQNNRSRVETKAPAKKSVFEKKRQQKGKPGRDRREKDEFEQTIIDIARVTRVMAGGKRMRFRACVAIGDKKGKVGIGLAKGADVTVAVTKAVSDAKKRIVEIPIVNDTIPHEIFNKKGAAKVLLKPASRGKGVIAGGAARALLELSGIKNVTSKILGTNNKVNIVKCTIEALDSLKKVEVPKKKNKKEQKKDNNKKEGEKKPASAKSSGAAKQ